MCSEREGFRVGNGILPFIKNIFAYPRNVFFYVISYFKKQL